MQKKINKYSKQLKKEIKIHKFIYLLLGVILALGLFVRIYRVSQILGFYFDQGRDALVIWDLIHSHKFFLIGPTTGLAGIFRGPYYYYLIAPFYFLGRGNPIFPSVFLALTTIFAIYLMFLIASKIADRTTGIIAAIIASFSFYIVMASRWLSNPTPMLLLSMILVWAMLKVTENKKWAWPIISLVFGLSLFNFGSSGEFFYFPALFIFCLWQWKNRPDLKNFILSIVLFISTFAPLVLFDLKHGHILLHNFLETFAAGGGSFKQVTSFIFQERNKAYWDIFTNKLFDARGKSEITVIAVVAIAFFITLPKMLTNKGYKIILLLLISPIIGLYFYQGNYGVLYDYYMTGYYLIFILLFAIILGKIWRFTVVGKIFVVYFFYLFLVGNIPIIQARITDGCITTESICFVNQKAAIDWIYNDAKGEDFNVDVYVPPVIPYAYNYLLTWKSNPHNASQQVPLLYTLYEIDTPHPERLNAWLTRQKGIGKVQYTYHSGGITVERRLRIK
jgi:4-amino-4-deoxy-L-arabinose transferase-like glycosyltransferase